MSRLKLVQSDIENLLSLMADANRFREAGNPGCVKHTVLRTEPDRLAKMIAHCLDGDSGELDENELDLLAAAGRTIPETEMKSTGKNRKKL